MLRLDNYVGKVDVNKIVESNRSCDRPKIRCLEKRIWWGMNTGIENNGRDSSKTATPYEKGEKLKKLYRKIMIWHSRMVLLYTNKIHSNQK